jgi:hypothetical protein
MVEKLIRSPDHASVGAVESSSVESHHSKGSVDKDADCNGGEDEPDAQSLGWRLLMVVRIQDLSRSGNRWKENELLLAGSVSELVEH